MASTGRRVIVVGGGAAGFFGAIACAEADPSARVSIHEATRHLLAKVRISGGGRCNVTHACLDPVELSRSYPRGARELIGAFHRFGPADTADWFRERGVELKTEADGRMFPVTDDSATIVGALLDAADRAGVEVVLGSALRGIEAGVSAGDPFSVELSDAGRVGADRILIATGGGRLSGGHAAAQALGHTVFEPVPSLFTFHIEDPRLEGLAGIAVSEGVVSAPGAGSPQRGPVLITHAGLSGPAILRLSAWGARAFHAAGYRFELTVNWSGASAEQMRAWLEGERAAHPRRKLTSSAPPSIPGRLWERILAAAGAPADLLWTGLSNERLRAVAAQASGARFAVAGKSLNKEEFVSCGGVSLAQVDMASVQSRLRPGLHFAGEVLDIDAVTGGYNFQAAWTTGWLAGRAMAQP